MRVRQRGSGVFRRSVSDAAARAQVRGGTAVSDQPLALSPRTRSSKARR